jgi:small-conductance mechanosensitive channel
MRIHILRRVQGVPMHFQAGWRPRSSVSPHARPSSFLGNPLDDRAVALCVAVVAVGAMLLRLALWTVVILMALDNFGIDITTLVASLGVGGIAVALATQNIPGDLFALMSMMLDKPFEIGDFIIVGDVLGAVEHIGLNTARLRGLGGEQVVSSNGDLLKSRIHNRERREVRRVAFVLRVAYGIGDEKLCRVARILRDIISAKTGIDFERAHCFRWSGWSLDVEAVYHFRSPNYVLHMDAQQEIFPEIYRRFQQEGMAFAHLMSIVRLGDPHLAGMAQGTADAGRAGPSFHRNLPGLGKVITAVSTVHEKVWQSCGVKAQNSDIFLSQNRAQAIIDDVRDLCTRAAGARRPVPAGLAERQESHPII